MLFSFMVKLYYVKLVVKKDLLVFLAHICIHKASLVNKFQIPNTKIKILY